jgi:hypothetical protein
MKARVKEESNEIDITLYRCDRCRWSDPTASGRVVCRNVKPAVNPSGGVAWPTISADDYCSGFDVLVEEPGRTRVVDLDPFGVDRRAMWLRRHPEAEIVCESDADRELLERVRK